MMKENYLSQIAEKVKIAFETTGKPVAKIKGLNISGKNLEELKKLIEIFSDNFKKKIIEVVVILEIEEEAPQILTDLKKVISSIKKRVLDAKSKMERKEYEELKEYIEEKLIDGIEKVRLNLALHAHLSF